MKINKKNLTTELHGVTRSFNTKILSSYVSSVVFLFLSLFCLLSCGLEAFYYIDYIPDTDVVMTDNTFARVQLPSSSAEGYSNYFTNFVIYYRVYISGEASSGLINTSDLRRQVNSALDSDFLGMNSLTDKTSTSVSTSNLENTFIGRKYFRLTLEEEGIDSVLNSGSLGKALTISFSPVNGVRPVLTLNEASYTLRRAVSGPGLNFNPVPDNRYFLNHPDLYNTANVTNEKNADTASNSSTNTEIKYTYVSMYIFAIGKEYLTTIYSQPTHIGIFRLPEAF